MKSDLITIFNQLTSRELADCNLFDGVLENHYEKVKYLYSLLHGVNMNNIKNIYCDSYLYDVLDVVIVPKDSKYNNNIIKKINKNKDNYYYSKYFEINIIEIKNFIKILISVVNGDEEDKLYENRLI